MLVNNVQNVSPAGKISADIVLKSKNIFTAIDEKPFSGCVAVKENKIIAVDSYDKIKAYIDESTNVVELGDKVITPGFVDTHTFFTGYVLGFAGMDLSSAASSEEIITLLKQYEKEQPAGHALIGRGWNNSLIPKDDPLVNTVFPNRAVIIFSSDRDTCWMNRAAADKYKFTPETCYPEAYYRLLKEILTDEAFIADEFIKYMQMLNSRGITAVKEMGFDDFYGFADTLEKLEKNDLMSLRVAFMSQPVGSPADLKNGAAMRSRFKGPFVQFSGFNRMTDGSISQCCADISEPYLCKDTKCAQDIDYKLIEEETLAADALGFRFSLHAQGDAAIRKVLDIYDKCSKTSDGKLVNRHAMTDLEFSNPKDLERMGRLGVIAEVYPQIPSFGSWERTIPMINSHIGESRGKYYWNRRKMIDSGVTVSCGTDLPLLIADIPASAYHACGGLFPEGGKPFNKKNTITIPELLKAWTINGQIDLYNEHRLGTLEAGKLADIAVLDADIFSTPIENMRSIKVCLTLVDGKIVYSDL